MRGGKVKINFKGATVQDTGGDEGRFTNLGPLDAGEGQCSRHVCREYRHRLSPIQKPQEVPEYH